MPQLNSLDERMERVKLELEQLKKLQDSDHETKVDKNEFQLIALRVAVLDKFDPRQVTLQMEHLQTAFKHTDALTSQVKEQVRKVEATAAQRSDLAKIRQDVNGVKDDIRKLQGDVNQANSSIFQSNKQLSEMILETKSGLEKETQKLALQKAGQHEMTLMMEKITKLESSMRDNRSILSSAGGQEISAVVKRIILNMEDKILILERRVDGIVEGREYKDLSREGIGVAPSSTTSGVQPTGDEAQVQQMSNDVSGLAQMMQQLMQDVNLNKVEMEQMHKQAIYNDELSHRLTVAIENSKEEEATTLSLNRVQLMIQTAARHLVAGSKWVTKDTFDMRILDLRKEYNSSSRQLQVQLEDLNTTVKALTGSNPGRKLPAVTSGEKLPNKGFGADPALDQASGRIITAAVQKDVAGLRALTPPLSHRGPRPFSTGNARK